MQEFQHTRRALLKAMGLAGAASLVSGCKTNPTKDPEPGGGVYVCGTSPVIVRPDVTTLDPTGPILTGYRTAITAMQALPASNPESWQAQANIHQDHCPHSNWFFLPWHRGYLEYFERIIQKHSGMKDWALPYWNWTTTPQIPAPFWSGVLNDPTRTATPSSTANSSFVGPAVINNILTTSSFLDFASFPSTTQRGGAGYGILEGTPHNYIHGFVGGNMGTFMSPLDPIFWLHHANVDRLWVEWIEAGHSNSADNSWLNFVFPKNFWDPCTNTEVDVTVSQTLTTVPLGYRYDTQGPSARVAAGQAQAKVTEVFSATGGGSPMPGNMMSYALGSGAALQRTSASIQRAMASPAKTTLRLGIEGIEAPASSDVGFQVFANCDYLNDSTPDNDPHYVGSLAFFEHHGDHGGSHEGMGTERNFYLDLAPTLDSLRKIQGYDASGDDLSVQLRPVGVSSPAAAVSAPFTPRKISLSLVEA